MSGVGFLRCVRTSQACSACQIFWGVIQMQNPDKASIRYTDRIRFDLAHLTTAPGPESPSSSPSGNCRRCVGTRIGDDRWHRMRTEKKLKNPRTTIPPPSPVHAPVHLLYKSQDYNINSVWRRPTVDGQQRTASGSQKFGAPLSSYLYQRTD